MTRDDYIDLSPRYAALSVACGGNTYLMRRDRSGRIVRHASHESSIIVMVTEKCGATVERAVIEALLAEAPRIAAARRTDAQTARERAAKLLAEADALDAQAAAIDAALAAAQVAP